MTEAPIAYTVADAAAKAAMSRSALYEDIKAGRLVARKRGSRTFILASDLIDYLKSMPIMGEKG